MAAHPQPTETRGLVLVAKEVDTWLTERWLAGVAVARSRDGDWRVGGSQGSLSSTLTAVHPYVQWSDGARLVWTTAGGGRGRWRACARSRVARVRAVWAWVWGWPKFAGVWGATGAGVEFGLRAAAAWAQLGTDASVESIDGQTAAVNQKRVEAEVSRPVRRGGLSLSAFGAALLRRDGGVGQTGAGLDVSGGVRATTARRLRVERRADCQRSPERASYVQLDIRRLVIRRHSGQFVDHNM